MFRPLYCAAILSLLSLPLASQQNSFSNSSGPAGTKAVVTAQPKASAAGLTPISRLALGGGIGIMGVFLLVVFFLFCYTNIRLTGNLFSYTVDNISSNGFNATGKLDFATMGASVDLFPWPNHGFRLSPGLLLHNQIKLNATAVVNAGQSFSLDDVDYYSSASDPIHANAKLGLNSTNPAFTMTTGWGNMISRRGGHWSFPFQLGAAFVGFPSFMLTVSGTACDYSGENCFNAATDPTLQSNLQKQIDKYKKDVDVLKVFPILSTGVSYNFSILRTR